jgi:hypothetical protein
MTNPYQPPRAAVADVVAAQGSPFKGVVFGLLVDIGGSIVGGLAMVFVYGIVLATSGASQAEIEQALTKVDPLSWFSIIGFTIGTTASFLGGYVCARVARAAELKWAGVVAAVSGIVSLLMGTGAYSFEWNALLALVGMGAVIWGGWVGARRNAAQP